MYPPVSVFVLVHAAPVHLVPGPLAGVAVTVEEVEGAVPLPGVAPPAGLPHVPAGVVLLGAHAGVHRAWQHTWQCRVREKTYTLGREEAPKHFFRRTAITSPHCQVRSSWFEGFSP